MPKPTDSFSCFSFSQFNNKTTPGALVVDNETALQLKRFTSAVACPVSIVHPKLMPCRALPPVMPGKRAAAPPSQSPPTATPTVTADAIKACIARILAKRRDGATMCPSEAARALAPAPAWRLLMDPVRQAAIEMVAGGSIEITQRGTVIDPTAGPIRGPIRLRAVHRPAASP